MILIKKILECHIVNRTELAQVLLMEQANNKIKINSYSKEVPNQKIASLLHTKIYNIKISLITAARKDRKEI